METNEAKRVEAAIKILIKERQPHYYKPNNKLGIVGEAYNIAFRALNEKLQRLENPPLTLEELKQMEDEPVWTVTTGVDGSSRVEIIESVRNDYIRLCCLFVETYDIETTTYGKSWLAYRHKPANEI